MAIYVQCLNGCKESSNEIIKAVKHAAKTGHQVRVTGTANSAVKDEVIIISRLVK